MDLLRDGQILSYPGWEADKAEAETLLHHISDHVARRKLIGMKNKQRLFDGDRSHPEIVSLDSETMLCTYDGWQEDKKKAEQIHTATSLLRGVPIFGTVQEKVDEMKKKQTMHSNRWSVAFLNELDSQTFSYTGWQVDKKEAEHFYNSKSRFASTKLTGMKNKQRLFDGDRSHPEIVALDSPTTTFTYPGWQKDKEEAERIHTATTVLFGVSIFDTVETKLAEMKRKQAMHSNRSGISFLRELDSFVFSYAGWQDDKLEAETFHFTGSSFARKKLTGMKNKQRLLVNHDRSHPELAALDNISFTYPEWQEDKKKAEQIHTATSLLHGVPTLATFQDKVNEMKKKQTMHSNRSSVAFLRDLDSVLPRQQQTQAYAHAPPPQQQQQQPPPPPAAQPRRPARRTALRKRNRHVKQVCSEKKRAKADPVEKDDKTEPEGMNHCVICMEREPTHAFIPCGHQCVCASCASQVASSSASGLEQRGAGSKLKCPVCRVTAMCVTKIFL